MINVKQKVNKNGECIGLRNLFIPHLFLKWEEFDSNVLRRYSEIGKYFKV